MSETLKRESKILIVDDDQNVLQSYDLTLKASGIENLLLCNDSREVSGILKKSSVELIILDLTMPYISGEELLGKLKEDYPEIPIIIITGNLEIDTAVNCMKKGALDYMIKPVDSESLVAGVKRAIQLNKLLEENRNLKNQLLSFDKIEHKDLFKNLNSQNSKMKSLFKYAEAISLSPEPVLLTGETGVGKELMARAIHTLSRREGKFVPVSIAGLDENMFSDALFGHNIGAFTDAHQERRGLIEKASGGTLFLDEIGDLSRVSQVKLLRLIQEKEYSRLGEDNVRYTDTHIITATNRDLSVLIKTDQFRKDLYYRLEVHKIHIPPLHERKEDLPLLIDHFLDEAAAIYNRKKPGIPEELYTLLDNYSFPGNIRELRSMIINAVSSHRKGILSLESFRSLIKINNPIDDDISGSLTTREGFQFPDPLPTIRQTEGILIEKVMVETKGNQSIAADILGITRQTLNKKLNRSKK